VCYRPQRENIVKLSPHYAKNSTVIWRYLVPTPRHNINRIVGWPFIGVANAECSLWGRPYLFPSYFSLQSPDWATQIQHLDPSKLPRIQSPALLHAPPRRASKQASEPKSGLRSTMPLRASVPSHRPFGCLFPLQALKLPLLTTSIPFLHTI
jgi:hypothetical protein